MSENFKNVCALAGHRNWVTSIVCPRIESGDVKLVSASRDKTIVVWKDDVTREAEEPTAFPIRRLEGHTDFVSDVAISNNAQYLVSASWDKTLRLWNLKNGETVCKITGHTADVVSVTFSPDNRQIISGSRDGKIKSWSVNGECMYTFEQDSHDGWVNTVCFSLDLNNPTMFSGGADGKVKVWSMTEFRCIDTIDPKQGPISAVTVAPDNTLIGIAFKNGNIILYDTENKKIKLQIDYPGAIYALAFSPVELLIGAATADGAQVWSIEDATLVGKLVPETTWKKKPHCISIAWELESRFLYAGFTDNIIREYFVNTQKE